MFQKRFTQIRVFRRKSFILVHIYLNDEIRITIQNQDLYVLSHESYLNFQGIIRKKSPNGPATDNVTTFFFNNCMAYFLDEIRYEINGCEIDKTRFVNMTTTLKNCMSLESSLEF